jgi:hypothetical protein
MLQRRNDLTGQDLVRPKHRPIPLYDSPIEVRDDGKGPDLGPGDVSPNGQNHTISQQVASQNTIR